MSYYFSKTLTTTYEKAVDQVTAALKDEGFGILTVIDVKETLKKKLEVDFRKYVILGACNPPFAHKALLAEEHIGLMLPCNVIVQENQTGQVEVAVVDPIVSMQGVDNPTLGGIATEVQAKLKKVIDNLT